MELQQELISLISELLTTTSNKENIQSLIVEGNRLVSSPDISLHDRLRSCIIFYHVIEGKDESSFEGTIYTECLNSITISLLHILQNISGKIDQHDFVRLITFAVNLNKKRLLIETKTEVFEQDTLVIFTNIGKLCVSIPYELGNIIIEQFYSEISDNPDINGVLGFFHKDHNKELSRKYYQKGLDLALKQDKKNTTLNISNNLVVLLFGMELYSDILESTFPVVDKYSNESEPLSNIAVAFTRLKEFEKSRQYFEQAEQYLDHSFISTDPNIFKSNFYSNYAFMCDRSYAYDEVGPLIVKSLQYNPSNILARQSYCMEMNFTKHSYDNRMKNTEIHRHFNSIYQKTASYSFSASFFQKGKINIGFVSADLRQSHAVYYFLSTFLHFHNRSMFNVICFSEGPINIPGAIYARIDGKSAKEASDIIYSNNIHILIDLSGQTTGNRLDVFKNKPAPIQITWIGYPFTTGLDEMDYRITDQYCEYDTEVSQPYYSEKLLCLENCFTCYRPNMISEIVEFVPEEGHIVIGCYNRPNKMSKEFINLLIRVLREVDRVNFVFNSPAFRQERHRISFLNKFPTEFHSQISFIEPEGIGMIDQLNTYNKINIQIDTFPYSGTTTSCESMLMGVPSLSLYDNVTCYHVQNVTNSLLINSNLEWYSCDTEDELIDKIQILQSKPRNFWETFKTSVKDNFLNGYVCNQDLHLQNVQQLFSKLYLKHMVKPENPEKYYLDYTRRDWEVDWDSLPTTHEELTCVIVEPRKHSNLVPVLRNFASKLNQYPIVWFCSEENSSYLEGKLPPEAIQKINKVVFTSGNIDIQGYNNLMTNPNFWDLLKSKRVLIFQTDTALLHGNVEPFLKYSYIGAAYPQGHATFNKNPIELVCGNGGLSLRDPKLMKRICENPNPLFKKFPEDFFFSNHLTMLSKTNPDIVFPQSIEEASLFSSELIVNPNCFGTHAVYKYHDADTMKTLFT